MGRNRQFLGGYDIQTRKADFKTGLEKISIIRRTQVHLGIYGDVWWNLYLQFTGGNFHRADKAG